MSGTRWSAHPGEQASRRPAPPAGGRGAPQRAAAILGPSRASAPRGAAARAAALLGGALLGGLLTVALTRRVVVLAGGLAAHPGAAGPDDLVELGILAAGVLVLAWLVASCALTTGCLLARGAGRGWRRGEAWVHRFAPALLRRALVVSVVAGLGIGGATGATAASRTGTDSAAVVAVATVVDPAPPADLGWVVTQTPSPTPEATLSIADASADATGATPAATTAPTAPSTTTEGSSGDEGGSDASPAPEQAPASADSGPSAATGASGSSSAEATSVPDTAAQPATSGTVVVTQGDTLWGIAARHLGGDPSDAAIAAAWPAWYDANAATIGADPGLILPGQVLRVPAAAATETAS